MFLSVVECFLSVFECVGVFGMLFVCVLQVFKRSA